MRLQESVAKACLADHGATVPKGVLAMSPKEVAEGVQHVGFPAVLKAQVTAGGRGKAGLIRRVDSPSEAVRQADLLFGCVHEGETVRALLVEENVSIARELFVSLSVDDVLGTPMLVLFGSGGIDVEDLASSPSRDVIRLPVDTMRGLRSHDIIPAARELGLRGRALVTFLASIEACWETYVATDASQLEINPMVVAQNDDCVIVDAKVVLDGSARSRHPALVSGFQNDDHPPHNQTPLEAEAEKAGIRLTELGGAIAVLSGGAGMTMAIIDAIADLGGSAANFLDIMGGASANEAAALARIALKKVAQDPAVRVMLINLSLVASPIAPFVEGFEEAFREQPPRVPVVGCVQGTGAAVQTMSIAEATERVHKLGAVLYPDIESSIRHAIAIVEQEASDWPS